MELLEEMDQAKPFYSNVSVDCFRLMKDRSWWIKKRLEQSLKNQDFSSRVIPSFSFNCFAGKQNLRLLASMSGKENIDIEKVLKVVGLECAGRKKVGKYSMGMRQRLGIAQAIMENQSILILDEPMNGLDNKGVDEIRKLILDLKKEGRSIILASHNREDIQILCDQVYEMDNGKIIG